MNGLYEAALEIQNFLEQRGSRFCIIGGLAVIRWGSPRTTQDVDISLFVEFGKEAECIDELLGEFSGRLQDARQFALENRVLLLEASNGTGLDIALSGFPFEKQMIGRASRFQFAPGVMLVTASAEDTVVLKAFAGRDQDWADVGSIITRQSGRMDWGYVEHELRSLCQLTGDDEPLNRLQSLRN